jgi:tetratricopeptide (TPR) repeat protein
MASQDPKIDNLHQKASAHYLQGEFQAALKAWRELLKLEPEDDRALEGVKLCEMLAEDEAGPATGNAESAQAPQQAAGPTVEGFDDDLEELDAILDSKDPDTVMQSPSPDGNRTEAKGEEFSFEFSAPDSSEIDKPAAPAPEGADRQTDGIDLGDNGASDTLDLAATDQLQQDVQFEFDPQSLDLPDKSKEQQGKSASPSETAAAELQHRVNELLSEAESLQEKGDLEGAMAVINRVFILDDQNETAIGLKNLINAKAAGTVPPGDTPAEPNSPSDEMAGFSFGETPVDEQEVDFEAPPAVEVPVEEVDSAAVETDPDEETAPPEPETVKIEPPAQEEAQPEPIAAGIKPPGDEEAPAESVEQPERKSQPSVELAVEMPRASFRDRLTLPKIATAGVILIAIAAGGFSAYWFVWGPGASSDSESSAGSGPGMAGAVPASLPPIPDLESTEEDEEVGAVDEALLEPEQKIDLAALKNQADEAYRQGDYSDAVVYYNRLLEADPGNEAARRRLEDAGERFRAKKELEEKRAEAFAAYNKGNYRAALSIFYRMPEGEDPTRLQRYKRNGWYNMGLQALAVGDCVSARSSFKEAQDIDQNDKMVIVALDLARVCRYSRGESSFQEEVRALPYRSLED